MPVPYPHGTRFRTLALASALAVLAVLGTATARAAVSPYPPIPLGNVLIGSQLQSDVSVPLSIPVSAIPSAYDAQVVYATADATELLALNALGLSSPVTVGQLKSVLPTLGVSIPPPTGALDDPSGFYSLTPLGCTATACVFRATFAPGAVGTFTAQLAVSVASITFVNGGLLGAFANAIAPLVLPLVNNAMVYDFTGNGVVAAALQPGVPVSGPAGLMLLAGAALVLVAGFRTIGRRRGR